MNRGMKTLMLKSRGLRILNYLKSRGLRILNYLKSRGLRILNYLKSRGLRILNYLKSKRTADDTFRSVDFASHLTQCVGRLSYHFINITVFFNWVRNQRPPCTVNWILFSVFLALNLSILSVENFSKPLKLFTNYLEIQHISERRSNHQRR